LFEKAFGCDMVNQNRDDKEIDEQQELERALSMLRPAASRIDRDCFLFLAGRASAEEVKPGTTFGRWMWPAATFMSTLAAVVLLVLLVTRTGPEVNRAERLEARGHQAPVPSVANVAVESAHETHDETQVRADEAVTRRAPTADETARALAAESNYPRLRSFVLVYGIDALPEPVPIQNSESSSQADEEPVTVKDLLSQTLKSRSAG
jgi:hypothetical protein